MKFSKSKFLLIISVAFVAGLFSAGTSRAFASESEMIAASQEIVYSASADKTGDYLGFETECEVSDMTYEEYLSKEGRLPALHTAGLTDIHRTDGALLGGFRAFSDTEPVAENPGWGFYSEADNFLFPLLLKGNGDYGKGTLNEFQKAVYDNVDETFIAYIKSDEFLNKDYTETDNKIEIPTKIQDGRSASNLMVEALAAALTYTYDHPQIFYVQNRVRVNQLSDTIVVTFYIDTYYLHAETRVSDADDIVNGVSEWIGKVNNAGFMGNGALGVEDKTYMKALMVHDLIDAAIDYANDPNTGKPSDSKWAHSMAGVFNGKGVVCEGYAKTFQYLMNLLGEKALFIISTAEEQHAWNELKIGEKYYPLDATWDDISGDGSDGSLPWTYYYFCSPSSAFSKEHTPADSSNPTAYWMFRLPKLADDTDYYYYSYFNADLTCVTYDNADDLVSIARDSQYGDYLQIIHKASSVSLVRGTAEKLGITLAPGAYRFGSDMICYADLPSVELKADSITLSEGRMIEVGQSITLDASVCPEQSDDRLRWRVMFDSTGSDFSPQNIGELVEVRRNGRSITIKGLRDGRVSVTVMAAAGEVSDSTEIIIGSGVYTPQCLIYVNGGKDRESKEDFKSVTITPNSVKPTKWTDSKQKVKEGKLVYVVTDAQEEIAFDTQKHKVKTKSSKLVASVNGKGVVTAKKAGTAYVHIIDTGTMQEEVIPVVVETAPSKVEVTKVPGSSEKSDKVSKIAVFAGQTQTLFITPSAKGDEEISSTCTYSLEFAKQEDAKYLDIVDYPALNGSGYISFQVAGKSIDTSKNKPASVKLIVSCNESKKKKAVTVVVVNSANAVMASLKDSSKKLEKKGDTAELAIDISTPVFELATTDKIKLYVGMSSVEYDCNSKKVVPDKGATVKASLSKDGKTITLKAGKDAGTTAVIAVAANNSVTKETRLFTVATVDAEGNIIVK